jgi:undecaprenyl-diphosphatase
MNKLFRKLQRWDSLLCVKIFNWNGKKFMDRLMIWASRFGNGYLYPVVGLAVSIFDASIVRQLVPAGVMSFFVEHTTYKLVKSRLKRPRPSDALPQIYKLVAQQDRFSFPSGHAAGAFLMATLFGHFYPGLHIPFYSAASIIGVSRIYNGLHYPSDVMAGTALGVVSARIGLSLVV